MDPDNSKFKIEKSRNVICSVTIDDDDWFLFAHEDDYDDEKKPYFLTRGINADDSDPDISTSEFVNLETGVAFTETRWSDDYDCEGPSHIEEGITVSVPTLQQVEFFLNINSNIE